MTDAEAHPRRRQVLAVCCLSLVLVVVGVTSLNVALPSLQRDLEPSAAELLWIVDAYALVFAGALLPAGALGDRFGRKGALVLGLGVVGVGSLLAGLSANAVQLIAARALMGVGAAFVMPATLSIITTVFPPSERPRAIAVWAGFAGAGGGIGLLTSGLVLEVWTWSATFFITVPIVGVTLALAVALVPTSRDPGHTRLDPGGALLSVAGLFALLFAIIEGPEMGWGDPLVVGGFGAAAVTLAAFVAWELRTDHPMLDPRFFRDPRFTAGAATITLVFFVTFGMFFLVPQYLQLVQGHTALAASVRQLPSAVTLILVAPRAPAVAERLGGRRTVALGLGVGAVGYLILSRIGVDTPYAWIALALVLMAAGSGLAMPSSTAAIVAALPPAKAGVGSAVNDLTREVGGALGIAVLGSIAAGLYQSDVSGVAAGLPDGLGDLVEDSLGGAAVAARSPGGSPAVLDAARDAFASAAGTAFLVAAGIMAVGAVVALRFHRHDRGAEPVPDVPPGQQPAPTAA